MKIIVKLCLTQLLILVSQNAFAWGATGHRSIGLIAEQHLNPTTLKKSQEILDGHSLAYVSTWAD